MMCRVRGYVVPLTVEAALSLEVFSRVHFKVYAGEENLHRTVRWVHPVEIPDIARFLKGGEMLLTAGLGIDHRPAAQRAYVRALAEAGAAVLIIELSGRAYSEMPEALVDEAARLGLPLVGLDGELPFLEVSAQVHGSLVDERVSELTAYDRLNDTFMRLLLAGRDHVAFTQALANEIAWPVILEDASRRIVAYSAGTDASDTVITGWDLHSRVLHARDSHGETIVASTPLGSSDEGEAPSAGMTCTRRAILIRGERWGWLHVIHDSDALLSPAHHAIDRTADVIAISVLSAREVGAQAAQRENALVNRLLLGDISGEAFISRALRLGKDLRGRPLIAICAVKESASDHHDQARLSAACQSITLPAVVADIGDHVMAIVGLARSQDEPQIVAQLAREKLRSGVSRTCPPTDLSTAIRQARSAASVAASHSGREVVRFDDLGLLRLLVSLSQGPELANYVDDELGPVLRHDADSPYPLLPTLRAFLENDANKSKTADQLYIQRRTLYYRLERLDALLGRSLDESDVRQSLALALHGLDLLQQGRARTMKSDS
ncbi:PucR family transcriptional regulator (plasmid) [Streptosporangium sp. CA-135522]|uniref:PucR family transcriptional regulator n=1 Tax=Streptosporangium sp. CA-135522 TaxID=3240072 RepID=UPI003D8A6ECD